MSSTRKSDNAAKILSKITLEPCKKNDLWHAIERRIDDAVLNEESARVVAKKPNRSNWGQLCATVVAIAMFVVGIPTLIHDYQVSNINNNSLGNSVRQTNPNSGLSISKSDIEKYYAANHQTLVKVSDYPSYHAEIAEASYGPTFAPEFDWWDLTTGKRYQIAGPPNYMNLEKVISANEVVFIATGANHISPHVIFPYYVVAKRPNDSVEFTTTNETAYLPVQQTVTVGDMKVESLSLLSLTSDGITMGYSAIKGQEGSFAAGSYGAPTTSVSFVPSKNQMIITLKKTTLSVKPDQVLGMQNPFVQSVSVRPQGSDVQVVLNLSNEAKFYTGTIDQQSSTPTLKLQFTNTNQTQLP